MKNLVVYIVFNVELYLNPALTFFCCLTENNWKQLKWEKAGEENVNKQQNTRQKNEHNYIIITVEMEMHFSFVWMKESWCGFISIASFLLNEQLIEISFHFIWSISIFFSFLFMFLIRLAKCSHICVFRKDNEQRVILDQFFFSLYNC